MNQKLLGVLTASFLIGAFLVSVSASFLQQSAETALDARTVGEDVYTTYCASCHGELGDGKGPAAYAFAAEGNAVTNFVALPIAADEATEDSETSEESLASHYQYGLNAAGVPTDEALHETILYGRKGGAMPAFPLLSVAQRDAVIEYIKVFRNSGWPSEADVAEAEDSATDSEMDDVGADASANAEDGESDTPASDGNDLPAVEDDRPSADSDQSSVDSE